MIDYFEAPCTHAKPIHLLGSNFDHLFTYPECRHLAIRKLFGLDAWGPSGGGEIGSMAPVPTTLINCRTCTYNLVGKVTWDNSVEP